ncbi:unknown [Coprobacillus sp. CAG:605]|nr:unknown [Coprobacillus sp. CAG:605]
MKNNKTFNKLKFIVFSFLIFIVNMNVSYAETDDGVKLCQGILGEDLTALLKDALRLIQIAGPILVIIMTIIDLIKATATGGKDDLSKVGKKTVKRLIYAVLLFLIPTILNWVFSIFGVYGVCGIGTNIES